MTEEFKSYRLRLIAAAVEKINAERETDQQLVDDFRLDEVDCD